ncbi:Pentatricopeptide repeat [Arabidopsis suecica]|uniref:Pentatricopeptide repeat n=1 Tax=Arabidopsis suecica TaxID=45249 RepID=A0A8T2B4X8_ARASU|nr:Pentatricopeptide repeat [Arabidopsis suecica]KAG7580949.1 Pentatricopeptide repeat [Arabidopsis suecica]
MTDAISLVRNSAVAAVPSTQWNVRLRDLASQSLFAESISLYWSMLRSGSSPDACSFPFTLKSCAALWLPVSGQQLHCHVIRGGFEAEPFVLSALISMYCKCGLQDSVTMLGLVPLCTVPDYLWLGRSLHDQCIKGGTDSEVAVLNSFITIYMKCGVLFSCAHLGAQKIGQEVWKLVEANALISMFAMGCMEMGEAGLTLFDDMIKSGIRPDGTVFVMVLSACSHSGLTDKGLALFSAMKRKCTLDPGPEHYTCVVDLVGRAGRLDDAMEFIGSMSVEPDGAVQGALFGAYSKNQEGIRRIRAMMRERERERAWIQLCGTQGNSSFFLAGDRSHEQAEEFYRMLDELETSVMEIAGNTDCDRGEEVSSSSHEHSERLAVAFGILNSIPGT